MPLSPCHCFLCGKLGCRFSDAARWLQRFQLFDAQLISPKKVKFCRVRLVSFPSAFLVGNVFPNRFLIAGMLLRMRSEKCACLFIDFVMAFRKTIANFWRDLR